MSIRTRTSALFGSALVAFVILFAGIGAANSFGTLYRDGSGRVLGQGGIRTGPPTFTPLPRQQQPDPGDPHDNRFHFGEMTQTLVGTVFAILIVALVACLLVYLARTRSARRRPRDTDVELAKESGTYDPELVEAVRAEASRALASFETSGVGAGEAVIECWRRMAAAAAERGIVRRPTDTSSDLAARVLARTGVGPATIGQLAELYRQAMFAPDEPSQADAERAAACLRDIVRQLGEGGKRV